MNEDDKQITGRKRDPEAIEVVFPKGSKQREFALAKLLMEPTALAASAIKAQNTKDEDINVNALMSELNTQVSLVKEGNLGRAEAMLVAQAHTLDALFAELIARARLNMGEYMDAAYKYTQLAFKAQSQCRTTLETLAEIKNPRPLAFIRQQNVGENVQVNNGPPSTRAGENSKVTNELLEDKSNDQQWLEPGAPEAAIRGDQDMEALGV